MPARDTDLPAASCSEPSSLSRGSLAVISTFLGACLWPLAFLYYVLRARHGGKYAESYRQRLGLDLPRAFKPARRVWVHALSVGEVISVVPLVQALKREWPEYEVVFSTATESGQAIARRTLAPLVERFFYLPHDFPWAMKRVAREVAPELFILVETDVWPSLLRELKARRVTTVLVNGRISEASFKKLKRLKFLGDLFRELHVIFAQSAPDKARYEALGVRSSRVVAMGNLKFDAAMARTSTAEIDSLRLSSGIREGRAAWAAGSIHAEEEETILRIHRALTERLPGLLLILAPRQIDRAREIIASCDRLGLSTAVRTRGDSAGESDVYVLDTLGELARFYALADAVFIGGSLAPLGGHNPLEAVARGKPVCWGPHLSNFREMEGRLLEASCGKMVPSEAELLHVLTRWLEDPEARERSSAASRDFIQAHTGCSERIVRFLASKRECERS